MLKPWKELPDYMRIPELKPYYKVLYKKRNQLAVKRVFDVVVASIMLVTLAIPMLILAIMIKLDSKGPVFYRQERITAYGKKYKIHKFRTMVNNADKIGTAVTVGNDARITNVGEKIRKYRLDELPQLIDILEGNMTFVGTRPEAVKYVEQYKPLYYATLLLPAGITSECSIIYKDEDKLLNDADDADKIYINRILPSKMRINLKSMRNFSIWNDMITMIRTVEAVFGKE